MESLQKEGLTKSIGVSNHREEDLLEMKDHWTIPPVVNQVYLLPVGTLSRSDMNRSNIIPTSTMRPICSASSTYVKSTR